MIFNNEIGDVNVKFEICNYKGFFIQEGDYKLMSIDEFGWVLICLDDVVCYYVDLDNLKEIKELIEELVIIQK